MFDELTALLNDTNQSSNGSLLITSIDFDSNFLLQHFLSYALKNTLDCLYISFLTPFSHLKHVQSKMGNNLRTPEISSLSSLMFIPLFTSLSEQFFNQQSMLNVDDLCTRIKEQVVRSPKLVIVEDLQILRHLLKYTEQNILEFQRRLRQLFVDAQFITQLSISDDDVDTADNDEGSTPMINMLKRLHDKHIFVRNLMTGSTKDITGQVRSYFFSRHH
jgi:hypothetical protein